MKQANATANPEKENVLQFRDLPRIVCKSLVRGKSRGWNWWHAFHTSAEIEKVEKIES